jgi:CHAD domain-containing protein
MSIRLKPKENLEKGVQRVLRHQIDEVIADLKKPSGQVHDVVHDTRTGCKKTRAVLRLVKPHIHPELYRRENLRFRDAARPLTEIRDAEVRISTLDKLYDSQRKYIPKKVYQRLRKKLEMDYRYICEQVLDKERALDESMSIVMSGLRHVNELRPHRTGWPVIEQGLKQTYRRGYSAYNSAADVATMENLHEWRKQAKYLWYQLQLMEEMGKPIQKLSKQFHKLTDLLGNDHDLAMLEYKLQSDHIAHKKVDPGLTQAITRQRQKLQKEAVALGKKIYDEKPRRFVKEVRKKAR